VKEGGKKGKWYMERESGGNTKTEHLLQVDVVVDVLVFGSIPLTRW